MNTLLFLVSVVLICSCSVSCVFLFSGSTDRRIRRALLASLSRFHGKEAPLTACGINSFESAPSQGINFASRNFPFDLKQKIFEFLDFKHLSIVSQVNMSMKNAVKIATERRLSKFHSHFATEDPLVNNLLYSVLNEHFRCVKNANDPLIHDHLQLLCAKYFFDDLDFSVIPSNIYYYIICFMFEMIYETNLRTPVSIFEFLNDFVCSLRVSDHSLEKSYSYVFSKCQDESMHSIQSFFHDLYSSSIFTSLHIEFFYSKPTIDEIKSKFSIGPLVSFTDILGSNFNDDENPPPPMIIVALLEAFLPEISDLELLNVFELFGKSSFFSHYSPRLIYQMACANMYVQDYSCTNRKYNNRMDTFDVLRIDDYFHSDGVSVVLVDTTDDVVMDLRYFLSQKVPNIIFAELLIKECKGSIDPSICKEILKLSKTWIPFTRLLVNGLPNDDPFVFIYFPIEVLKRVKCLIQDKFDLNKVYSLQGGPLSIHVGPSDLGYNIRDSRTFSFKEAIASFDDAEIISIFTSNPEEFNTFKGIKFSTPIIKDRSIFKAIDRLFEEDAGEEIKTSIDPVFFAASLGKFVYRSFFAR
jgi:hypothetical protein